MKSIKCSGCNAVLKYNVDEQKLKCEYCGTTYEFNEQMLNDMFFADSEVMNVKETICPECGATLITDPNTISTNCAYCKAALVYNEKITKVFMPKKILLFEMGVEKIKERTKKWLRENNFYVSEDLLAKLQPIYVPYWIYDCVTEAEFHDRNIDLLCRNVITDASKKISDILSDRIEGSFDLSKLKKFNPSMISGYVAEKYDVNFDMIYNKINEKLRCAIDEKYNDICCYTYTEMNDYENCYIL